MKFGKNDIDEQFLFRLKNGDLLAFNQIYEMYSRRLFSFIFRILKNENDTADIVQDVFVKIWESRDKFLEYKLLNSFIFTVAYNSTIDLIRKRVNSVKYLEHLKNSSVIFSSPTMVDETEFNDLSNRVEKLIASLPERQREVYVLHREKGLTYPEIAEQLGISRNTVANHMTKALKYLHQNIDGSLLSATLFAYLFL